MREDTTTFGIRHATLGDAEVLRDYAESLFCEDLPGIFKRPVPTLEEELQFIHERLDAPNSTLLVAWEGENVAGVLDFVGGSLAEEAHAGTFGLSVEKEHRGEGVGTALIEHLIAWAPGHGIRRIQAWAWATNPGAIALYERLGFEREGLCRAAIVSKGEEVDVVGMALHLPAS